MTKSKVFKAVATACMCVSILMILLVDNHPYIAAFMVIVCLFAAEEFHNIGIREHNKEILDLLDQDGTGND